jgi:hypothetical protein
VDKFVRECGGKRVKGADSLGFTILCIKGRRIPNPLISLD